MSSTSDGPAVDAPSVAEIEEPDRYSWRARYLAGAIVTVVFCGYCVVGLRVMVLSDLGPWLTALGFALVFALLAIQLLYFSRPSTRSRSGLDHWMLAAQAVMVYLPIPLFGQAWVGLPSFLAGSVLVLRPALAWPAFTAIVASMAFIQSELSSSALDVLYTTVGTAGFGIEVYLLTELARLVTDLHAARAELARTAVAEERLQFSRNLHDLLGASLSDIVLKGELVHRMLRGGSWHEGIRMRLAEIGEVARRALADARSVASGYRELSLEGESRLARSLLAASDIDAQFRLDLGELPVHARSVVTEALREGVGHVLRFTDVQRCEIVVRQAADSVLLDIVHDGKLPPADAEPSGLPEFRERIAEDGGEVTDDPEPGGGYHLRMRLPVRADPPEPTGGTQRHVNILTTKVLVIAVFAGMLPASVLHVLYLTRDPWQIAVCTTSLTALLALQLWFFVRATSAQPRLTGRYWLLLAQAALIYLPLLPLQENWVSRPGFLAGTALLLLRPAAGWAVFAASVASVVLINAGFGGSPGEIAFNIVAAVNSGAVVYGLIWLTRLAGELETTRTTLAQAAITGERLRFARDLHDLLGLSLTVITVKSQLADRLLAVDQDRARTELTEILDLARKALTDVRSVASGGGTRELSLDEELRSAEAVLGAADVRVRIERHDEGLPAAVSATLAVVLREGVTNVLRHSKGENCEITVRCGDGDVRLDIVNDGVDTADSGEAPGSGIRNMSDRITALGGSITTATTPDGRFRLRAVLPAQ